MGQGSAIAHELLHQLSSGTWFRHQTRANAPYRHLDVDLVQQIVIQQPGVSCPDHPLISKSK